MFSIPPFLNILFQFSKIAYSYYLNRHEIHNELNALSASLKLLPEEINRLSLYAFLNEFLSSTYTYLNLKTLSAAEKQLLYYISVFTANFDDLMDDYGYNANDIILTLEGKESFDESIHKMSLCKTSFNFITDHHPNIELFNHYFKKAVDAQERDLAVSKNIPGVKELLKIMEDKGGYSLLMIFSGLSCFKHEHEQAVYELGSMIQFANDVFDIYKDTNQEERTYVTEVESLDKLMNQYQSSTLSCFQKWNKLEMKQTRFNNFWINNYALLSRAEIAIDYYNKAESTKEAMIREEWVCDMERAINLYKNFTLVNNWFKTNP